MNIQRTMQRFYRHSNDGFMYAITSCPKIRNYMGQDGDTDAPGLKITIPHLTRETWEHFWKFFTYDPIDVSCSEIPEICDEAMKELLFLIFSGQNPTEDWKITSVGVWPGARLRIDLQSTSIGYLRRALEVRERQIRDELRNAGQEYNHLGLDSWLPTDQFAIYLTPSEDESLSCSPKFRIVAPNDKRRYEITVSPKCGVTYVKEIGKKTYRELEFQDATETEGGEAEYVNVVVTEAHR